MSDLAAGARNLLFGCGGFRAPEPLLVVAEDPALGWFDAAAPEAVAAAASEAGLAVTTLVTRATGAGEDPRVEEAVAAAPNVVYFARLGDRGRFAPRKVGQRVVVSYATSAAALASPFGTTPHAAMAALKRAVDEALFTAAEVTLACPLGTRVTGRAAVPLAASAEVGIRRFPLGVPTPLPADGFAGAVVLARHLAPTGNRAYAPAVLDLAMPVVAEIADARITALLGDERTVDAVAGHYRHVADLFGIDPGAVHSFHAGIHPATRHAAPAAADADRWANTVFQSPRVLHFHTCGAYAPGEICWMVIDPTITLDGAPLWRAGVLNPEAHPAVAAVVAAHPALGPLCALPPAPIGV